jgi:hypothetical protein
MAPSQTSTRRVISWRNGGLGMSYQEGSPVGTTRYVMVSDSINK